MFESARRLGIVDPAARPATRAPPEKTPKRPAYDRDYEHHRHHDDSGAEMLEHNVNDQ
jgi:hypothetical protein